MSRMRAVLAVAVASAWLAACPAPSAPAPLGPCTSLGAKCKTPAGPLGVCDSIPCPGGGAGPCFTCQPQH